jgi:hypothetical protein
MICYSNSGSGCVFLAFLIISASSVAGDFCDDVNKENYKYEARVLPEGSVYVVAGRGGTYFYSAPDVSCRKRTFVVRGDQLQVYTEYGDYISVMYFMKGGGTEEGWVLKRRLIKADESSAHHR